MSGRTQQSGATWRDTMRAGGESTAGTGSASSGRQEPSNLYPIAESGQRTTEQFSTGGTFKVEEFVPSTAAGAPRSAMKGTSSAAGSAGGSSKSVVWADHLLGSIEQRSEPVTRQKMSSRGGTYVDREAPSSLSRAFLNNETYVVPDADPSRKMESTRESKADSRKDSYLRDVAGMEYSLGRLDYLSLTGAEEAPEIAAMTTNARENSRTAELPEGQAIDLGAFPSHVSSMVQSIQLPVEAGSALSEALSRSRPATAAPSVGGSGSDGEGQLL